MTGLQATVLSLDCYGDYSMTNSNLPIPSTNFPYGNFPVDLVTDPEGGVYARLHSITNRLMVPVADPNQSKMDTIFGSRRGEGITLHLKGVPHAPSIFHAHDCAYSCNYCAQFLQPIHYTLF
jgi:hypothetical protein